MKKVIVIPDSFKGTMSSSEICAIMKTAIHNHFPACEVVALPIADGGEGTVDCFLEARNGGERVTADITGPYGERIQGQYARFGRLAVVEMAAAAGLPMVGEKKDPSATTTFGVGQLIRHAVVYGATQIILGLGGSCTNDAGCGCAAALGVEFYKEDGTRFVPVGATLDEVTTIDITGAQKLLEGVTITAMCDVKNPLLGANGAAYVYAPQKGADETTVALLDDKLKKLAVLMANVSGHRDIASMHGAGAAGGFGAGVVAFLGGQLQSGIETVLDVVDFNTHVQDADLVFTGEGKIDGQSLSGKAVAGVAGRAKQRNVPVFAVVGDVGEGLENAQQWGISGIFSINRVALPFAEAKHRSRKDMADTMDNIMRLIVVAQGTN